MELVWEMSRQIDSNAIPGGTTSYHSEDCQPLFIKDGMIQTRLGTVPAGHWEDVVYGDLVPLSADGYSAMDIEHHYNSRAFASVVKNGAVLFLMHSYQGL